MSIIVSFAAEIYLNKGYKLKTNEMMNRLFIKDSVLPVTLFCSALAFSPLGVSQAMANTNVVQQTMTVKGTVVDNNGEPIIGASIKVVGSSNGTVTDLDGNFTLNNVSKNATIEVSYIGYVTQKVNMGGAKLYFY